MELKDNSLHLFDMFSGVSGLLSLGILSEPFFIFRVRQNAFLCWLENYRTEINALLIMHVSCLVHAGRKKKNR